MSVYVYLVLSVVLYALVVVSYLAYGANLRTMKAHETGPAKPFYRAVRWSYFWEVGVILGGFASIATSAAFILAVTS